MKISRYGRYGLYLAALPAIFLATAALAQSLDPSPILNSTGATDESKNLLRYIFGAFSDNPFTTFGSAPSTLLGQLFLYLNAFIFFMAALWSSYTILSGVVATAHEGEFLGKRYSTVWYPIRLVWGAATLVPVFGGFSLGQAIYMFFTLLSVGAANGLAGLAVQSQATFTSMVRAPSGTPGETLLDGGLPDALFKSWLCAQTLASQGTDQPDSVIRTTPFSSGTGSTSGLFQTVGIQLGTNAEPELCGSAGVSLANAAPSANSLFGFTVNSVNYAGIAQAIQGNIQSAHQQAMMALSATMQSLSAQWYQSYLSAKNSGTQIEPYPFSQIAAARTTYDTTVQQAMTSALASNSTQAITSQALSNMQSIGWAGLGAWYETFAEVNSAISDAAKVNFTISPPTATESAWQDVEAAAEKARVSAVTNGGMKNGNELSVTEKAMYYIQQKLCDQSTGNISIGQCLLHSGQWLVFQNSGGSQLVDPIIAAKNLGDDLMVSAETLWSVSTVAGAMAKVASESTGGKILIGAADHLGMIGTMFKSILEAAVQLVHTMVGPLFVIGMVMSIYIPLIPFITWFSALMTWLAVIVESIIAAPIWSMAHAEGDGEGMGQRTQHGYLFLLNVMFRAPLMVVSFFVASASTIIAGTLLYKLFGTAVSNAAGNSIVGLFSIFGYLIILTGLMILVIQTSFNLVHIIPDQVLGWIGGNLGAHLGREMEGRTHALFLSAGRHVQGSLTPRLAQKRPGSKPPGNGGGNGGGNGADGPAD